MDAKKSENAKIENYSGIFFQLGLVLALLIIYLSLEHKVPERSLNELINITTQEEIIEDIPITERIEQIKPPPPPPPAPEVIEIVEDQTEVEETILESTETDQSEAVEVEITDIVEVVEEEEIAEDVPFAVIEEAPIFPGCKGNKAARKKCFEAKIKEHVSKRYDINIAQELGLEKGKKKVYVLFRINKKGNVADIQVRGPHARLEKEAYRVISQLPKMVPAKQRGRSVGVKYTVPITLLVIQ